MARRFTMGELMAALKTRWTARSLDALVPIWGRQPPERTQRPYVTASGLVQAPARRTNKGQYDTFLFELEVQGDKDEDLSPLVGTISDAVSQAPLVLPGINDAVLLECKPGPITYFDELTYTRAVMQLTATIRQTWTPSPA